MGIRLYPIISEDSNLQEVCDAIGVEDVNGFDLFGWGKFNPIKEQRTPCGKYIEDCGELRNTDKVLELGLENQRDEAFLDVFTNLRDLLAKGLIDGVYWC